MQNTLYNEVFGRCTEFNWLRRRASGEAVVNTVMNTKGDRTHDNASCVLSGKYCRQITLVGCRWKKQLQC
jgi:hypothetical protein